MNRIISPLNIASLLFLVVILACWDQSNKTQKREQQAREEQEYVNTLRSITHDDIIEQLSDKMPLRFDKWMQPTFRSAHFDGDTLVFKISDVDDKAPFTANLKWSEASDAYRGTISMIAQAFNPQIVDYIALNKCSVKFIIHNSAGQYAGTWTALPPDILRAYISYCIYHDAPLKDYLIANES